MTSEAKPPRTPSGAPHESMASSSSSASMWQGLRGRSGRGEESEMKAKVHVTVDTATLSRPPVERLLRQHQFLYDIAGTEPERGDAIEVSGGQSPYCLPLPDRATDAETA